MRGVRVIAACVLLATMVLVACSPPNPDGSGESSRGAKQLRSMPSLEGRRLTDVGRLLADHQGEVVVVAPSVTLTREVGADKVSKLDDAPRYSRLVIAARRISLTELLD